MDKELVTVVADPADERFQALARSPERCGGPVELKNGFNIALGPGARGHIELDALAPFMDAPFYRVRPCGCEARSWYRMEYRLSPDSIRDLSALVVMLEASSPEGVTVFALLRVSFPDGRSADLGSAQIEVQRNRRVHALTIALGDHSASDVADVTEARLCFVIEARPAALHIHRLGVQAVEARDTCLSSSELQRLRNLANRNPPRVRCRRLCAGPSRMWTGTAEGHRRLSEGGYIDFDPLLGRSVGVAKSEDTVCLTMQNMNDAQWCSLEFRFTDVVESGALSMVLRATGSPERQEIPRLRTLLRQYDETGGWDDTTLHEAVSLFDPQGIRQTNIDLSPLLDAARQIHRFGLMLFLPVHSERFGFSDIEVFVIDHAPAEPAAVSRIDRSRFLRTAKRIARGRW